MSGLLLFLSIASPAVGYTSFQKSIPNGDHVPGPAQDDIIWHGVGHLNAHGKGILNPFGTDFKANHFVSTVYVTLGGVI